MKFKKQVTWKKKPAYDSIIGGTVFVMASAFMFGFLTNTYDRGGIFMAIVFTLLFSMGFRLIRKGLGKGREVLYIKK